MRLLQSVRALAHVALPAVVLSARVVSERREKLFWCDIDVVRPDTSGKYVKEELAGRSKEMHSTGWQQDSDYLAVFFDGYYLAKVFGMYTDSLDRFGWGESSSDVCKEELQSVQGTLLRPAKAEHQLLVARRDEVAALLRPEAAAAVPRLQALGVAYQGRKLLMELSYRLPGRFAIFSEEFFPNLGRETSKVQDLIDDWLHAAVKLVLEGLLVQPASGGVGAAAGGLQEALVAALEEDEELNSRLTALEAAGVTLWPLPEVAASGFQEFVAARSNSMEGADEDYWANVRGVKVESCEALPRWQLPKAGGVVGLMEAEGANENLISLSQQLAAKFEMPNGCSARQCSQLVDGRSALSQEAAKLRRLYWRDRFFYPSSCVKPLERAVECCGCSTLDGQGVVRQASFPWQPLKTHQQADAEAVTAAMQLLSITHSGEMQPSNESLMTASELWAAVLDKSSSKTKEEIEYFDPLYSQPLAVAADDVQFLKTLFEQFRVPLFSTCAVA